MSPTSDYINGEKKSSTNGYHHARTRAPGQPLRRGDACLMCRAKKLKCSAQKPVCDQCAKRKDRCVYDGVRPASRVEKLQRKLAEMEDEELREAFEARRRESLDRLAYLVPPSHSTMPLTVSIGQDNGIPSIPDQWNYELSKMGPSTSDSGDSIPAMNGHNYAASPPLTGSSGPLTEIPDAPAAGWPWGLPQHNGFTLGPSERRALFTQNGDSTNPSQRTYIPWPFIGASSETSSFYNISEDRKPVIHDDRHHHLSVAGLSETILSQFRRSKLDNGTEEDCERTSAAHPSSDITGHLPSTVKGVVDSVMEQKRILDERTPKDGQISDLAREYLLNLFFYPVPPRPRCGSEVLTETRFRAKLTLPENEQPHPCLLFSMYATATAHSYVPAIRKLGEALYTIAKYQLDEAVRHGDRLIDAINASKNLSEWLYTKGRRLEGYQMSCQAISLCMACRLHQIPSSSLASGVHLRLPNTSGGPCLLPPARDQGELCERIHAFWSAWRNDRGGHIIDSWPSAIRDDQIITPLPRPAEDYHTSLVYVEPDVNLRDLYDLPHRKDVKPFKTLDQYKLVACHLVHRAMGLSSTPPENASTSYRSLSQSSVIPTVSSRKRHLVAYHEIVTTSIWLEENLPQKWKVNRTQKPMWTAPDVPVVALLLKIARLHLHSVHVPDDCEVALKLAFECAALIEVWLDNLGENIEIQEQSLQTISLSNEALLIAIHDFTSRSQDRGSPFSSLADGHVAKGDVMPTGSSHEFEQNETATPLTGIDVGPETPQTFRNLNGISGPYCLSPVLSVVKYLVQGQRIFAASSGEHNANRCATKVGELVNRLKSVASNGSIS
ncbi:hypothetical protein I316_07658 [Kwoniella heveanensis BCC8398]|uniref:Zn(2)-C6 fungal-type domain-containing protein n=1 Tax=Kwoniella heveanensis BCC8398 TaxID=1296120 RepID=A0A1B9GHZ2_9TREE|nr:hypothetical protein I316_07658 [Kwoniella heveanensis BCC8398]